MTKLARTIRFDESDDNVFARAAQPGEWAIPGGFEYADLSEAELTGKLKQAFAHGWLSLESFGRASLVAVARIGDEELDRLARDLARLFVRVYGAPDEAAALPAAREEIAFMLDLCADHDPNTLLAVSRELTPMGVRERFKAIPPQDATLDLIAVHARFDDPA